MADPSRWREEIFRHLDGIVTAPTAFALHRRGVLAHLREQGEADLADLARRFGANEGYLNVALRVLASQGWLDYRLDLARDTVSCRLNAASPAAFDRVPLYADAVDLLALTERYHPRHFEVEPFRAMEALFERLAGRYRLPTDAGPVAEQILRHIEGLIVGPTAVHLGMGGMFHKYFMEASFRPEEFHRDPDSFTRLLEIFARLGWFEARNGTFRFTEKGLFLAQRASAYGVTVSYIPTLRKLDDLIFGDPMVLRRVAEGAPEQHVDREMNVWGSGGAHASYFRRVDDIVIELFNRPIAEQPRGILDLGCGNGAFLEHVYEVIERQTLRGKMLADYPLFLVGVDFNPAALKVARRNLVQADIWAKVIWGDIGRPDLLAEGLRADYRIDLADLLNVRTFLDHNRPWREPSEPLGRPSRSTGAFASAGRRLSNAAVEASLTEHLRRWAPYLRRFGLLTIELHTLPPELAAAHLGATPVTAYDATHGYSDQYIVEVEVFQQAARAAGLEPDVRRLARFPDSELATVAIHYLQAR
ncbi:MAG: class I SAM-dependent methyltransferase [Gemmatimonadetes bacterium]|nr:class I SAM-dependent methyltransferase [Gemmatimonadota bacterium]